MEATKAHEQTTESVSSVDGIAPGVRVFPSKPSENERRKRRREKRSLRRQNRAKKDKVSM